MLLGVELPKSLYGKGGAKPSYLINIYLFTRIYFKTRMEVWNLKPLYDSDLNVFKVFMFVQIKLNQLDGKGGEMCLYWLS